MRLFIIAVLATVFNTYGNPELLEAAKHGDMEQGASLMDAGTDVNIQNTPLYNTLYGTDCSIPEGVRFVHYPMIHPYSNSLIDIFSVPTEDEISTETDNDGSYIETSTPTSTDNDDINIENKNDPMIIEGFSGSESASITRYIFGNRSDTAQIYPEDVIAYSSFQFIQLVKQYPSAVVFDEAFWGETEIRAAQGIRLVYRALAYSMIPLKTVFPFFTNDRVNNNLKSFLTLKYANSYEQLTSREKNILSRSSGGVVSYVIGLLDHIYPTTIYSSLPEFNRQYWSSQGLDTSANLNTARSLLHSFVTLASKFNKSHDEHEKEKIKQDFYSSYQQFNELNQTHVDYVLQGREQALADSVSSVLEEEDFSNNPILIAYGAVHNLTDDFIEQNLYTLPFSCTMPQSFTSDYFSIIFSVDRYLLETSEINRQILRQFIKDKWSRMNRHQRARIGKEISYNYTLVPVSEKIRRILAGEPFSEEEIFEFVFDFFTTMSPEEAQIFLQYEASLITSVFSI